MYEKLLDSFYLVRQRHIHIYYKQSNEVYRILIIRFNIFCQHKITSSNTLPKITPIQSYFNFLSFDMYVYTFIFFQLLCTKHRISEIDNLFQLVQQCPINDEFHIQTKLNRQYF